MNCTRLIFLNCLTLFLYGSAIGQARFKTTTYSGFAENEPLSLIIENVTTGSLSGKLADSQGAYPFSATVKGDSITQAEADLQVIRLAFSGRLLDRAGLRINFIAPDGSGTLSSVILKEVSNDRKDEPASTSSRFDPRLVGTWSSTVTETSGWGESLSMLSYEVVDVFYPDGTYGTGKGDMKTMDANYHGYDESIRVEKQPNIRWRTAGSTLYLELVSETGPQQMEGAYRITGNKLSIDWGDGKQVELTRRK